MGSEQRVIHSFNVRAFFCFKSKKPINNLSVEFKKIPKRFYASKSWASDVILKTEVDDRCSRFFGVSGNSKVDGKIYQVDFKIPSLEDGTYFVSLREDGWYDFFGFPGYNFFRFSGYFKRISTLNDENPLAKQDIKIGKTNTEINS